MKTKATTGISRLLPMLLLIFLNLVASAQDKTFNFFGKVIDEKTQVPLGGANVQIKGAYHQVIADNDGNFIVTAEQKFPFVLVVDYVGYESKEVTVTNAQKLIISLIETKNKQLNEVVVVGYGTQRKSDLTGAVATLNTNVVKQSAVSSFVYTILCVSSLMIFFQRASMNTSQF